MGQHSDMLQWKRDLFRVFATDEVVRPVLYCVLIGCDYWPKGTRGVGYKGSASIALKALDSLVKKGIEITVESMASAAGKMLVAAGKVSQTVKADTVSKITMAISWFLFQRTYDPETRKASRSSFHGLVMSQQFQDTVKMLVLPPNCGEDHDRSLGTHLGPLTPRKTGQHHDRALADYSVNFVLENVPYLALPAPVSDCARSDLIMYLRSFKGMAGLTEMPLTELQDLSEGLQKTWEDDLKRASNDDGARSVFFRRRVDPQGRSFAFYVAQLRHCPLEKVGDAVSDMPPASKFSLDNVNSMCEFGPRIDPVAADAWRRRKGPDGRFALSSTVIDKGDQRYTELPLGLRPCSPKMTPCIGDHCWFTMNVPASQTRGKLYPVILKFSVVEHPEYDGHVAEEIIGWYCPKCPTADAGACHHLVTAVNVACNLPERREQLELLDHLIGTSAPNTWRRGMECADDMELHLEIPVHQRSLGRKGTRNRSAAAKKDFCPADFDPRLPEHRDVDRGDPELVEARHKFHSLCRRDAWANRDGYTGVVQKDGYRVMEERHGKGQLCRLASDIFEAGGSDMYQCWKHEFKYD